MRQIMRLWRCLPGLLVLCGFASTSWAQAPATDNGAPAFLEDARKYVIEAGKDRTKLILNEKSLLNWTNPARHPERGAIYVWTHEDRPLAIGSLFTYEYNDKVYTKHELHSFSTGELKAMYDGTLAWNPKEPGISWQEFADGPTPKENRSGRLLQMRQLARPFRAELTSPKGEKDVLRLAPRPLFEYSSPKAGVLDGAIFSFVVATDPEVLLLIEAFSETRNGRPSSGFRSAFARMHYWNVAAYDGDRRVWEAPLDKAHELNNLGDRENIGKIYNSFHPFRNP